MSAPLLQASELRVVVDGAVAIADLTLTTRGPRVIATGAEALVAALTGVGRARVAGGKLLLAGRDVATGEHRSATGMAPLDPPLPPRWTVRDYLSWHARLAGAGRQQARALARAALELLGLESGHRRPLATLPRLARRALVLAAATLGEPGAIVIESPFEGLDREEREHLLALLARATEGRSALVSLPEMASAPEALLQGASDVCVLRSGRLVAHADPALLMRSARVFEVTVHGAADALREALAAQGLELSGGPTHYLVRAPEGAGASDILVAAARARAAVIDCLPVMG